MTDPPHDQTTEEAARIIANFCYLRGWAKRWERLSVDERNQFIGVVETLENQSYAE